MDSTVKTRVIKRNGEEVSFDLSKIISAISKANREVDPIHRMNEYHGDCGEDCAADGGSHACSECRRHSEYGGDRDYGDARV